MVCLAIPVMLPLTIVPLSSRISGVPFGKTEMCFLVTDMSQLVLMVTLPTKLILLYRPGLYKSDKIRVDCDNRIISYCRF